MNRLAWIALAALTGFTVFVVGDLLEPDPVPVAQAVELTGTVPAQRPPREGFFVVPPRVVDFRDDPDASDDSSESGEEAEGGGEEHSEDGDDVGTAVPDDDPRSDDRDDVDGEGPDDTPDELDDEDDSVDDD